MDSRRTRPVEIRRIHGRDDEAADDLVAIEEPLEIRLGFRDGDDRGERSVSITMRTPGNDDELAIGFLYAEGLLQSADQVVEVWHRSPPVPGEDELRNVIRVDLGDDVRIDFDRLERHFYTTSSCGVCGKASLEALNAQSQYADALAASGFRISRGVVMALGSGLVRKQEIFDDTGGLHASGLFDATGRFSIVREDVGRHNALDKLVGRLFLDNALPATDHGVLVSGRTSFELVQKVAMAGVPVLAAVGAPSSLAVDVAREFGITLIGFLRDGRFNIYSGADRIGA